MNECTAWPPSPVPKRSFLAGTQFSIGIVVSNKGGSFYFCRPKTKVFPINFCNMYIFKGVQWIKFYGTIFMLTPIIGNYHRHIPIEKRVPLPFAFWDYQKALKARLFIHSWPLVLKQADKLFFFSFLRLKCHMSRRNVIKAKCYQDKMLSRQNAIKASRQNGFKAKCYQANVIKASFNKASCY